MKHQVFSWEICCDLSLRRYHRLTLCYFIFLWDVHLSLPVFCFISIVSHYILMMMLFQSFNLVYHSLLYRFWMHHLIRFSLATAMVTYWLTMIHIPNISRSFVSDAYLHAVNFESLDNLAILIYCFTLLRSRPLLHSG